jgi:oxygen-independent coproporphyrinogen III oxidase
MSAVSVPQELLDRHDRPGPRYTSYPTVPAWSEEFGEDDYKAALGELADRPEESFSIYTHLPFCAELCTYCGCNATVTRKPAVVDAYLDRVERELAIVTGILGEGRRVQQLHWGGGTPNFLDAAQRGRLLDLLRGAFAFNGDAELSLEIDPRIADREQILALRAEGFNRISLGVQDFAPEVQAAIGRHQPRERTEEIYAACREAGFDSINLDLVYGLPAQSRDRFEASVEGLLALRPDRVALYSYAHVPWLRPNQRKIDEALLPAANEKFGLFLSALDSFRGAGYAWLGMDHFALPDDELAQAASERRLHRNFMGYTTRSAPQMLAFGNSGIGDLAGRFIQNESKLGRYQRSLDAGRLPVHRGLRLSKDDLLRRKVITHLICNLELPYALTVEEFGAPADRLLSREIEGIKTYADEGFVTCDDGGLRVTELGRFFIRNLCMELDAYLSGQQDKPMFSRTI